MLKFKNEKEREAAREEIRRAAIKMITNDDFVSLRRLYFRLWISPSFEQRVLDIICRALDDAKQIDENDEGLIAAISYLHNQT